MRYRCEATSIEGFVQQVAVNYIGRGYLFYSTGIVPERKDPRMVDLKLIEKHGLDISKWARARRKKDGLANVQYIRHGRFFVLLATHGRHKFFEEERTTMKDVRETPLKFASYAISYKKGHPCVRIERQTYLDLRGYFLSIALWSKPKLEQAFWNFPFEPWAPVRRQVVTIFKRVNEQRAIAGYEKLDQSCLRLRRHVVRPFEANSSAQPPSTHRQPALTR